MRIGLSIGLIFLIFVGHTSAWSQNDRLAPHMARPDQVLVLYNADWPIDTDGSSFGQDSKEVADYYVKMHTDAITGKKPYMLGLTCRCGKKHLNKWLIEEDSQDNKNGVVFIGKGKVPLNDAWPRDSRHVELILKPGKNEIIDWESVSLWCESVTRGEKKKVDPIISGTPKKVKRKWIYPSIENAVGRCYRFDASKLFKGSVWVHLNAKNKQGHTVKKLKFKYFDREDFVFSKFGADDVADEKNFQKDIEIPLKTFLEDPERKLPDGKYLRDHILYIVICHGLPFSCEGIFGIERGVTSNSSDHGDLASLEQRIQTLYYGWDKGFKPPVVPFFMAGGPGAKAGVRNYIITSALRFPLYGKRWHPYMHPDTYSYLGRKKDATFHLLSDFKSIRAKTPQAFFAYGVSRVDGHGPEVAKRMIDYAIYASKYLTPDMSIAFKKKTLTEKKSKLTLSQRLRNVEENNLWRNDELKALGFKIGKTMRAGFLGRVEAVENAELTKTHESTPKGGYYPGAVDFTVISSNGWNMHRNSPIWNQGDHGVTVSACGGPAYGGGPHITNATFMDKRILYRYLFRGRDLGECFLLSTTYVNWSTSLVGDPLYHPDLNHTLIDETPPIIAKPEDITIKLWPALEGYCGRLDVALPNEVGTPELALLEVRVREKKSDIVTISRWPIFSARPSVVLRNLKPETIYDYELILTDPYGNIFNTVENFGILSFKTGPQPKNTLEVVSATKVKKKWRIRVLKRTLFAEKGTIEIDFIAGEQGMLPGLRSRDFSFLTSKWGKSMQLSMVMGAPVKRWILTSFLQKSERAKMIVRWRRFPITREVLLRSKDGTEFTLLADVRTPFQTINFDWEIDLTDKYGVKIIKAKIYNDAKPASPAACLVEVPPIKIDAWRFANK